MEGKEKMTKQELEKENAQLKHIIYEIQLWARRYCHGRQSCSVGMYNDAIKLAQSLGMEFKPDAIDGLVEAKDLMFDKEWFEQNKDKK